MTSGSSFAIRLTALVLTVFFVSCDRNEESSHYRDADFNDRWQFHMGDINDPFALELNKSDWIAVHLPHDWGIMDYEVQDSLHVGPFFKDLPGGADVGYLRNGTGWYRKDFTTPADSKGKQVILSFDGVQTQMELWVNGIMVGEHVYGYTPFQFNIGPVLYAPGEKNVIAIKTINRGENSRWYAGAGIFRPVKLSVLEAVAIAPWGVHVTTPDISDNRATVNLEIEVYNQMEVETKVSAEVLIDCPGKRQIKLTTSTIKMTAASNAILSASAIIENPKLWDIDQPHLNKAQFILFADGREVDRYGTVFGIRSIAYSVEEGFLLNGEELLMKGACMHHDNGLLGAAAFPDADYRRVKRMKENGYNAIRTSHNPPSESFLDACDEIGMVVIDESFDHWVKPKRPNDYSNYFKDWHIRDVQAMVYRDRNHPSVVMWSFGNEIQERSDPEGVEIGKALVMAIKAVDSTRPVTQAVCDFWDNPGKEWDYTEGAFSMQDIGGYNYQFLKYESDHQKFPERMMYGSESVPQHAWENWEMVKRYPYVMGDFVWTGMDYIGESGIGHHYLAESGSEETWQGLPPWPWFNAWCGDIDILGNKKPQSCYRDVLWGESKLEMMVVTPVPEGKESRLSYWGWHNEESHWNWEGHEGKTITVKVYSSYPEVKLELNGDEISVLKIDSLDKYTARFEVPYEPGELEATGLMDGKEQKTKALRTSGPAALLVAEAEYEAIKAGPNSLAFVNVQLLDKNGIPVTTKDVELKVKVDGPAMLQAAGNASPWQQGSFTDETFKLFRGKGMVVVRSNGEPGNIEVEVSSSGMEPALVSLNAN